MNRKIANIINRTELSEKSIERYLVSRVNDLGLPCLKYANPGMVGYPDRLIVIPDGMVAWVELKSAGRHPSKVQQQRITQLESIGHKVFVIDSRKAVDQLLETLDL